MKRKLLQALAAVLVATSLSSCYIYDDPVYGGGYSRPGYGAGYHPRSYGYPSRSYGRPHHHHHHSRSYHSGHHHRSSGFHHRGHHRH